MPPRPDRNFWLLVGDAGLFSLAAVCFDASVVLPVFVAQFTTSPLLIGAPAAIRLGGLYLPQLPAALSIRRFQHIKGFLMWQVIVGRVALLACIPAALLAGGLSPELVLAIVLFAFAIFAFTEGAATLAWLDLVGDVIHSRLRGRYFGIVQLLGGIGSVGAGFGVRSLLADAVSPPDYAPLFAYGLVAFLLSAACIALVREPRGTVRAVPDEPTLTHVAGLLRSGHLVRLGVAQVMAGSLQLALPFYVLFGRDRLIVFGLAGAANGGSRSGFWQYILDAVPARDRRVFMGLANTANAPSLLMPIIGGLLLGWGGYNWLLAGSVLGGLGATLSGLWLAEPDSQEAPLGPR
jgi:hypothetical protein